MFYRGQSLSKVADKANAFNHYFTSVFTKENTTQLNSLRNTTTSTRHPTSIEVVKFDEDEVYKALCRINPSKSCGPDNIPGRILTKAALEIHEPLTKMFMSMITRELPTDWTRANVTPIHKKGSRHQPSNYRPVSLTSLTVKLIEQVIYNRISAHLSTNKKLSANQHGFVRTTHVKPNYWSVCITWQSH